LRQPVMVAQIDEQQLPVIALAVDPAREPDGRAGIVQPQLAAIMRSVSVHRCALGKMGFPPSGEGGNTTRGNGLVKACGRGRERGTAPRGRADGAGANFRQPVAAGNEVKGASSTTAASFGLPQVASAALRRIKATSSSCTGSPEDSIAPVKYRKKTGERWYRGSDYSPLERI
jgi:hypothetical protein